MNELKKRHGCLTVWLIMMILLNSLTTLTYLIAGTAIFSRYPNAPSGAIPVMVAASVLNVVFAVSLFRWKKWGFGGFVFTSLLALAMNLTIGTGVASALLGLSGIAILYGVLQIGGDKKGWTQLE